jgi:hypothetical protein
MSDKRMFASGNLREHNLDLRRGLMVAKKFHSPLFPLIEKSEDDSVEKEDSDEETEESDSSVPSSHRLITEQELRDRSAEILKKVLKAGGYDESLLEDANFKASFTKAIIEDGELITKKTGKAWIERVIPEEPPAFVRPGKLKVGDRVQLLNWVPLGVHGAKIDLFPRGKVSKVYEVKCLVTKGPSQPGFMLGEKPEFDEETRVLGVELDGKGPYSQKESTGIPYPFVTKDSSIIMRFPPMAEPSGETDNQSPLMF